MPKYDILYETYHYKPNFHKEVGIEEGGTKYMENKNEIWLPPLSRNNEQNAKEGRPLS
jgi:hypothetical protein